MDHVYHLRYLVSYTLMFVGFLTFTMIAGAEGRMAVKIWREFGTFTQVARRVLLAIALLLLGMFFPAIIAAIFLT